MAQRDYYEVLGVSKNASKEEIKKSYRKKALEFHPDRNKGDKGAEAKFKEAAEAYEVLSNEQKRQRYDQFGHAGIKGAAGGGGGFSMDIDDIFSQFGDIFGSGRGGGGGFFGGFGGGGGRQRQNKGSNLRIKITLTLKDILNGIKDKKVKIKKYLECEHCSGTGAKNSDYQRCSTCSGSGYVTQISNTFLGQMQSTNPCPTCRGEGKIIKNKCDHCAGEGIVRGEDVVKFSIPAGITDGMQMNIRGKGNAARRGGINGDLTVFFEEKKHDELQRQDNNLIYMLTISVPDAILGKTVEIPTIESKVKVKIEPGTQPDRVLRLRGKGLPAYNSYGVGDLLVKINVWIPKSISKEEKRFLQKLTNSENFAPKNKSKGFFEKVKDTFF